ncbi:hypothetical protein MANES_05G119232v8 [Manihot esculenta]|uniref:Uncharacterized protein n=1 Tax=Manihot esculenta TaxID=3983 RepID=A0ACB7HQU9_MANES|nr:hypothetical protein MANES_05G119232v8 [Manihot esculenta]
MVQPTKTCLQSPCGKHSSPSFLPSTPCSAPLLFLSPRVFFFFPVSTRICFFRSMQGFGFSFSLSRISHQLPHVHDVFTVSETSELGVYRFISFRVLLVTPFISLPHLLF